MSGAPPAPLTRFPVAGFERVAFLKPVVTRPNIEVGDYSYYDDPEGPERFEERNVLYQYDPDDHLVIGRYCALATGVTFLMRGANHRMDGPSTFPFPIFGGAWGAHRALIEEMDEYGETVVGHDVWIGTRALVMAGARIGSGAIIAAGSVVSGEVPPYAIAAGNPARVVRMRYDAADVARLLALAWWDWPVDKVTAAVPVLMTGDIDTLATLA